MNKKWFLLPFLLIIFAVGAISLRQFLTLRHAHATFENYYAFRGCLTLLQKTDSYGICQTASGEIIKIVRFQNKWYLDGDLPWGCFEGVCLGW